MTKSAALLVLLALAGCATSPRRPSVTALNSLLSQAAAQVRPCYRFPRVSHSGRQIVTRIRVRMTPEGYPEGLPMVYAQYGVTPENEEFADRMAEAAIGAVMRCAPLRLPPDLYEAGWRDFYLIFSPRASA